MQGSRNGHKESGKGKGKGQAGPRAIKISRGNEKSGHVPNSIKTAKYNLITFVPIFLWEMFSRMAYLYFLAQVLKLEQYPCSHPHLMYQQIGVQVHGRCHMGCGRCSQVQLEMWPFLLQPSKACSRDPPPRCQSRICYEETDLQPPCRHACHGGRWCRPLAGGVPR